MQQEKQATPQAPQQEQTSTEKHTTFKEQPAAEETSRQGLKQQQGSIKNNDHDIDPEHPQESSLSHR